MKTGWRALLRTRAVPWIGLLAVIGSEALSSGTVLAAEPASPGAIPNPADAPVLVIRRESDRDAGRTVDEALTIDVVVKGTSARGIQQEATRELPLDRLSAPQRAAAQQVLSNVSLYRRLPVVRCQVDPRVYGFFSRYPDVAVSVWRAMGISKLQVWQTGPAEYESDAGDGTVGAITVLHRDDTQHLSICTGWFKSPLLANPIEAQAILYVKTEFSRGPQDEHIVTHTADLFVCFPSQTIDSVARIISPLSHRIADRNFEEVSLFVRMMDVAMSRQPGWVENVASRMDGLLPGRKEQLLKLTAEVYVDAQKRLSLDLGRAPSDPIRLPPVLPASADEVPVR